MKANQPGTRVVFDAKGNARREVQVAPGRWKVDIALESGRLRALDPSGMPSVSNHATRRPGFTPYGDTVVSEKSVKQRSRLDYLRALSDEIKKRRTQG
jgi:hypothetical protein